MLRIGLWWPPLTILCWISTQWLWKVGVDSLHNPEKNFLQCIHVSTYIFWANTTLSSKWLNNLTNSLISTHTYSLTFYPSYETNLQKCEDRCCPNFPELSLLFCSTCTNLHKMHSTCLLSVQNPYMYFQTCLLFSPYAHLQLQVGWNLNLILEIYSLGWRWLWFLTGTDNCFFGNNYGKECFWVAKQILEKLLKIRFPVCYLGFHGFKKNNGVGKKNMSEFPEEMQSVDKASHTFRNYTVVNCCSCLT